MKTITVIFALIFACSLVLITDANQQERVSISILCHKANFIRLLYVLAFQKCFKSTIIGIFTCGETK